jgi:hypothetical protein
MTLLSKVKLTNHQNKEWCEHRILVAIEMFLDRDNESEPATNISDMIGLSGEDYLPKIYYELSNLHMPEWSWRCEHHNILNIPYYNCEKCGKLDDYGEPEIYGGLFCIDCQS